MLTWRACAWLFLHREIRLGSTIQESHYRFKLSDAMEHNFFFFFAKPQLVKFDICTHPCVLGWTSFIHCWLMSPPAVNKWYTMVTCWLENCKTYIAVEAGETLKVRKNFVVIWTKIGATQRTRTLSFPMLACMSFFSTVVFEPWFDLWCCLLWQAFHFCYFVLSSSVDDFQINSGLNALSSYTALNFNGVNRQRTCEELEAGLCFKLIIDKKMLLHIYTHTVT